MPSYEDDWMDAAVVDMGLPTETERSSEVAHAAADEIASRLPPVETVSAPVPERKDSKLRDAINQMEGEDVLGSTERIVKHAGDLKLSAAPITRPSGQVYHPRRLDDKVDVVALRDFRESGVTFLLSGYPGCGKTAMVDAAFLTDMVTVNGHGEMEMTEMIGRYVVRPGNEYVWVDGPLIVAMKEGKVLFIDDVTLVPPSVLARLYPVMDGRGTINVDEHEGETVVAAPGFFVVGAHNPGVPGAVLSEALASRFALHLDVPTDFDLAIELGVPRKVVNIARKLTTDRDEKGEIGWAPAMRELLAFKEVALLLSEEAALRNLINICPEVDREYVARAINSHVSAAKPLRLGPRIV